MVNAVSANPLTPSFPMEHPKAERGIHKEKIKEEIERIITPIFSKTLSEIPQEENQDSMTIISPSFFFTWSPHNYRRQYPILKAPDGTFLKSNTTIANITIGKVISIKNYKGCTIQIGKNKAVAIYAGKRHYEIKAYSMEEVNERIDKKVAEIQQICDSAMQDLSGKINAKIGIENGKWRRQENWGCYYPKS